MTTTTVGAGVAAILALTWVTLGFGEFVVVAAAMFVGAVVGRVADGRLDLQALGSALRGRRSSL